jgi:hypothetical protein
MFILKALAYSITILIAVFFGFWELRLKEQLTDAAVEPSKMVSDFGTVDLSDRLRRERALSDLPKQALFKLRMVVMLKFLFAAMLVAEVIVLQR